MNVRDPFNLHQNKAFDVFKVAASHTAHSIKDKAVEVGTKTINDMSSFTVPRNVPSFGNPQRTAEDHTWSASGMSSRAPRGPHGNGGILDDVQNRVDGFFGSKNQLPMYKDKPYTYAASRRSPPAWRRKRAVAGLLFLASWGLWYLGFLSTDSQKFATPGEWNWAGTSESSGAAADWNKRRERVKEAFALSWDSYERYGWGSDEYHPIAKTTKMMAPKGMGWIIVDALDTMMLMNMTSRLTHAREWLSESLTWDQNQDVNTFETTIRMMGGLLSAHYLSNEYPDLAPLTDDDEGAAGEDLYLEKAKDLADRLMSAFDSPSGIPYASVILDQFKGVESHDDGGASSTAEATTLQLEFKYLAKLTGEEEYWKKVEKVMQVVDDNGAQDGLVPIFIYAATGKFRGSNIRLGSRGDSYYEYLIKQYLQTNEQEPVYRELWDESLEGVRKHLITYTAESRYTVLGERPSGLGNTLSPKMDHLVCFYPGTIALGVTGGLTEAEARKLPSWDEKKERDMQLARELTQTCWGMYKYMATGLAAEITYFKIDDPPLPEGAPHSPPEGFDSDPQAEWRKDFDVHGNDVHNLQRPETVESLFYMWRITGDQKYRDWGWEMFKSFVDYTTVEEGGGFTSLSNANKIPPVKKDNLESFWMAETLKYLYLLFSPNDFMPLDKVVFNTEAHIFPRFDIPKLFSTGWERKPRDSEGKIVAS